ncbi:TetR family transcriptional regulator [Luteibacter sp. OK325]|jgi:TetR/AcrR family transcriptional repressor of nem operon|uniref:TetR/AcrR family transcriptional regulator n=1 Tax=Luteibacter sp. OK325 TaxID=2135670 RepID=UPI000D37EAA1|nr:TetR/AcrR family transcriptional regulator [Luteibacter sp. OK325]PTR35540.1 TetR family transcriptional regulator [Luteibacter sp. OK325]
MRYDKEHKDQTRQRIVETAAFRFREHGIEGEGVKSLMAAAGLTNGAFYNHFESKEDLAREAVTAALKERVARLRHWIDTGQGLGGLIRSYFSTRHRDNPGLGCPSSAVAAEVARHSDPVREAFTEGVNEFLDLAATQWPALPAVEARSRAIALYGLMAGTMQVARATNDPAMSEEVLAAGRRAALELAGIEEG